MLINYETWTTIGPMKLGEEVYSGVCDNSDQVLDRHPDIEESSQYFVVFKSIPKGDEQVDYEVWTLVEKTK